MKRLRRPDGRRVQGRRCGFVCPGGERLGGEDRGGSPPTAPSPGTLQVAAVILIYQSVAKPCGPVPENSRGSRSRVSSGCRLCGCRLHLWDTWNPDSSLVLRYLSTKPLILETGGQNGEDTCLQVAQSPALLGSLGPQYLPLPHPERLDWERLYLWTRA